MSTNEQMQSQIDGVSTNGVPDRDKAQASLTEQFIASLLCRGGDTPEEVAEQFARKWDDILRWLGNPRQDEIIKAGMREANVDLSHWLGEA